MEDNTIMILLGFVVTIIAIMTCILSFYKQQIKIEERKIQDGVDKCNK